MKDESRADSRRSFLKIVSLFFGGVLAAIASVPVVGALVSPLLRDKNAEKTGASGFLPAIALEKLSTGVPKRVELQATKRDGWSKSVGVIGSVWLIKNADGSVRALSTICPHSGCSISFSGKTYTCPCHASAFGLDGVAQFGPSPRGMDSLETEIRDGTVHVRYARFKVGSQDRLEI